MAKFMYGIGAVMFGEFLVGYIEKGSFDMGGTKAENTRIEAEQVPGTPVLVIPQGNGSIAPSFNIIQLDYANLKNILGGSLHYKSEDSEKTNPIGWTAPSATVIIQGPWKIDLVSGQSILIPNATLNASLGGKLTLTETAKIEATLEVAMPEDGGNPYGVFNSDSIPTEWAQHKLPVAASE